MKSLLNGSGQPGGGRPAPQSWVLQQSAPPVCGESRRGHLARGAGGGEERRVTGTCQHHPKDPSDPMVSLGCSHIANTAPRGLPARCRAQLLRFSPALPSRMLQPRHPSDEGTPPRVPDARTSCSWGEGRRGGGTRWFASTWPCPCHALKPTVGTRLLGVRRLGMCWGSAEPRRLPRIFHATW